MQPMISRINLYTKKPNVIYSLLYSIIVLLSLCIVLLIFHIQPVNPATPEHGVITLSDLLALGPESEVTAGYMAAYQEAMIQMMSAVDVYGLVHEDLIGDGVKQLILEHPSWWQHYLRIRKAGWLAFEEYRVADGVTFPAYNLETW